MTVPFSSRDHALPPAPAIRLMLVALGCCLAASPALAQRRPGPTPPPGPIITKPAPPPIVSAPQTGQLPGFTNRSLTTSSRFPPPPETTQQSPFTVQPFTSSASQTTTPKATTLKATASKAVTPTLSSLKAETTAKPVAPTAQPVTPAATSQLSVATTSQPLKPPAGIPAVPPRRPSR